MKTPKILLISILLVSCTAIPSQSVALKPLPFSAIPGWQQDDHAGALGAFKASCMQNIKAHAQIRTPVAKWQNVCAAAKQTAMDKARQFFEKYFVAFKASHGKKDSGLITGYYEPLAHGALHPDALYQIPAYKAPPDMKPGQPYLTRKQIEDGALKGRGLELIWFADPAELFFLQVQGSGRVILKEGGSMALSFAAKNNRPYTSIGKVLLSRGELQQGRVSLYSIKNWLRAHPDKAREVMQQNESYIFFKEGDGARGAQGALLTPERSLAVDNAHMPYGLPVFINTHLADGTPFRKLVVAQDTGSAIKGPLRGDIFFGFGEQAEAKAAHLQSDAEYIYLLPK